MRPAAFTASLLLHAGVLFAAWEWRTNVPVSHREGDGEPAPDFSLLAESGAAEPAAPTETTAVVELTLPPEQPSVAVETPVDSVVVDAAEAIAATPSGIVTAVPVAFAATSKRAASRSSHSLARGGSTGSGGGAGYRPPQYRLCPAPPYPAAARAQKIEGAALLLVLVDDAGRPTKVTLRRSTGSAILDAAAIRAVWTWRFEPARAGGQTITASVEVPIRFRYRD